MRILLINPNTTVSITEKVVAAVKPFVDQDVEIVGASPPAFGFSQILETFETKRFEFEIISKRSVTIMPLYIQRVAG